MLDRARELVRRGPGGLGPIYNEPLRGAAVPPQAPPTVGPSLVWVAMSGGGTRAAALGWHVLQALRQVRFPDAAGRPSTLAAEIDYISGISGGSFAAAAWCHLGPDSTAFSERFLERNIQVALAGQVARPWNAVRLPARRINRSTLAAGLYHRTVFDRGVFADLPDRPQLRIHATNLALGARFSFTQRDFGLIGSDLSQYPLGYACAASSAFPVVLAPLTLKNLGSSLPADELRARDPEYKHAVNNAPDDVEWYHRKLAREHYNDKQNRYIHLADGGLVDNQGLQAMLDEFDVFGAISSRLNDASNPLQRLVLVNVNAGTRADDRSGRRLRAPGVVKVMLYTMVTSMDLLSAKRWVRIREQADIRRRLARRAERERIDSPLAGLRIYTVEIAFRNLADDETRRACDEIPTSFALSRDELALVERVAPGLVRDNPDIRQLVADISEGG